MSCQQTPITTIWTPVTSNVPATGTIIHTSIITSSPSISTHLITSCLSTGQPLPTAQLHVSNRTKRASSSHNGGKEGLALSKARDLKNERSSFSLWNLLPLSPMDNEKRQIQVPSGLPPNCVSWTISSSFSTPPSIPSTSLATSTTVSTTQTTVWVAKETVWGGCEGSPSATETVAVSTGVTSTTPSPMAVETSSEASPTSSPTAISETPSAETSANGASSTNPEPSASAILNTVVDPASSTKQWVEETSKLNSMASALSSAGTTSPTTLSVTLSSATVGSSTTSASVVAITTTSEVGIAPIAGITTSSSSDSTSNSESSSSPSSSPIAITISASAGAGATTQGAMAVNENPGRDKAVSVGATIGGIIGLFGIIALILMGVRFYMRWKRGNKRKTIKMRQSWYPPGYDGPDHFVPTPMEKDQGNGQGQHSFFSMNGKNAIAGGHHNVNGLAESDLKSRMFAGLKIPHIGLPFFSHSNAQEQNEFPPETAKRLTMPAIFAGPLARLKPTNLFPALTTPWSPRRQEPNTPSWAEKYSDEPSDIYDGSQFSQTRNRDVNPPRSIMMRPPGFDGVVGPPVIDYQPPAGHMSWGPPVAPGLGGRPKLEWGHSYAASSINPNPRLSVIPPPPTPQGRPFVPGPIIPSSPTEESVYSKRDSQHSGRESRHSRQSRQSRQSKQSFHNRSSMIPSPLPLTMPIPVPSPGLNRKASRSSNPDLRSAILSRASASAASFGHWSMNSGTSDHSIPALPEGGLRFDFPLPPTPSTRAPTMYTPSVPPPSTSTPGNRALLPPQKRASGGRKPVPNLNSSVFEYEDYTRASTAGPQSEAGRDVDRDTIRQTANWYEKPLWIWDGQSGPLPRIPTDHGMLDGSDWRQSRKSVKWDPADGVARAL